MTRLERLKEWWTVAWNGPRCVEHKGFLTFGIRGIDCCDRGFHERFRALCDEQRAEEEEREISILTAAILRAEAMKKGQS